MMGGVNILYVTSEVARDAKTRGLAHVSTALPQYLERAGHDVQVFLPYDSRVDDQRATLEVVLRDRLAGARRQRHGRQRLLGLQGKLYEELYRRLAVMR